MEDDLQFGKYLKMIRKKKGLSLRTIEKASGVSNAYLSQVENGKRSVPTPDILMKIHEPLGVSYDELMEKAGYISSSTRKQLLPETIQTIDGFDDLQSLISNAAEMFLSSIRDKDGFLTEEFKNYLFNDFSELYPDVSGDILEEMMNDPNLARELFDHLTLEEKISFLNILVKGFVEKDIDPKEVFYNSKIESENSVPTLKVPVLGYIAAGHPILAEEQIQDWIEIPNTWNFKPGEVIVLKVKGDSMTGSRIYEGDKVVVKLQPDVENGEIAVVNVNGNEATLKRVKKTENGQVILYPDNPKYEPIFIMNENARIIGKVIQVMFEPS